MNKQPQQWPESSLSAIYKNKTKQMAEVGTSTVLHQIINAGSPSQNSTVESGHRHMDRTSKFEGLRKGHSVSK